MIQAWLHCRSLDRGKLVVTDRSRQIDLPIALGQPEIISRGFVYVKSSEELIADAKNLVKGLAAQFASANRSEWSGIKNNIRSALKNELYHKTKRTPIILPIIIEIDI